MFWRGLGSGGRTGSTVGGGVDGILVVLCLEPLAVAHGLDVHWRTSAVLHAGKRRGATEACDGTGALLCD